MKKKFSYKKKRIYIFTLTISLIIILLDITFFTAKSAWFFPIVILAIAIAIAPYWAKLIVKLQQQKEIESRFPEFVRNLTGAIKSGMPAPKAIMHISTVDYGALTPYVRKLANQIEWSIPLHKALLTFANDTKNPVIKRAISSVIEAEMSGGNIEDVLESITSSVVEIKKLKQRRRAATHAQVVQSYVIFGVFLVVMIIIQNLLVPYIQNLQKTGGVGTAAVGVSIIQPNGLGGLTKKVEINTSSLPAFFSTLKEWFISLHGIFLMISVIQAFFAGLVIGKLSEGEVIYGIKHSIILMIAAFFIISLSQGFA
ncbi:MAG: type II secretion system F family protein [Candidatus Woesearchaeota archaeon]